MSEEYGSDYISITDEDGKEYELEVLAELEYNGISRWFRPTPMKTARISRSASCGPLRKTASSFSRPLTTIRSLRMSIRR